MARYRPKESEPDGLSDGKNCLVPECKAKALWKGLCRPCYGCAKKLIDSK